MTLLDQNELHVSNEFSTSVIENMRKAAKWMRFVAIVGFVISAFMIIIAFVIPDFFQSLSGTSETNQIISSFGGAITIGYLIVALLFFIPNLFLFQSAGNFAAFTRSNENINMEVGFKKLHSLYLFFGVIIIIYLVIMVFAILGALMIT